MEDDNDSDPIEKTVINEYDTKHSETADLDKNGSDHAGAIVEDENVIDDMEVVYVTVDKPAGEPCSMIHSQKQ